MEVYRIAQEKFAADLSGNGARLYGGRWNSEGSFALYTASSRSLALLETLAHTSADLLRFNTYMLVTLFIPSAIKPEKMEGRQLPKGWDSYDDLTVSRKKGDLFLQKKKNLLLAVPSVQVPEEWNYLLNPLHPDRAKVKLIHQRRVLFDKRTIGHI